MSIMRLVGYVQCISKALEDSYSISEILLLAREPKEAIQVMDIKLIELDGDNRKTSRSFQATIDDVPISGVVKNVRIDYHYILRLELDNKEVKKHKKYPQIRIQLLRAIIKKSLQEQKSSYERYNNFLKWVEINGFDIGSVGE